MAGLFNFQHPCILRCPTGVYTLVGAVPVQLAHRDPPHDTRSKIWPTEDAVIADLLSIGCTRFQLADCSFYTPVADVARSIESAEANAAPLADLPFALQAETSSRRAKQGRLL